MRTTIDAAGRVVIPKQLRHAAALEPGQELEIIERDGRIEIEPVSAPMALVERDGVLAAEVIGDDDTPPMTADDVRDLLERTRR
jgi:AbrB family looped-hinge helix DNA binding protein